MSVGPWLFAMFALVHGLFALLAVLLLMHAPVAAVCLLLVEAATCYDNLTVAVGNRIGIGRLTQRLNRVRFLLHAVVIGLLLPVYVVIGSGRAAAPLDHPVALAIALILAAAIGSLGYRVQYRRLEVLMPVRYFGCLRYMQSVDAARYYPGYIHSDAELRARPAPPLASIITVLLGLMLAIWIASAGNFMLPLVVTVMMLGAAAFPQRSWGPLATSGIEIVYSGGMLFSVWLVSASMLGH